MGWLLAQGPAPARSQPFVTGFDDGLFSASDAAVRDHWLGEAAGAAAGIVRLGAGWSSIAPTQPPSGSGAEPGWPGYRWDRLDGAVRSASAHRLTIMITASGAPRWAEGADMPPTARAGTWKPDPIAYGEFGKALARRYSGHFPDPEVPGATLPRVRFFEAWNEPNLDDVPEPAVARAPAVRCGLVSRHAQPLLRGGEVGAAAVPRSSRLARHPSATVPAASRSSAGAFPAEPALFEGRPPEEPRLPGASAFRHPLRSTRSTWTRGRSTTRSTRSTRPLRTCGCWLVLVAEDAEATVGPAARATAGLGDGESGGRATRRTPSTGCPPRSRRAGSSCPSTFCGGRG